MDMDGPFGWDGLYNTVHPLLYALEKLKHFESMAWSEIVGDRHHSINIDALSSDAKRRLSERKLDDIDSVFSFALQGKERVIGIRDRDICELLWWDPAHQVCPSLKKHT
ncbi:MAG: hypothetical protein HQM04_01675 [Magnetococcales bacterium]|nr:hypothetical protein [Magnetococcales bacterium]MBF0113729.1 hypothetical protein [Magnetococcales bacterium]